MSAPLILGTNSIKDTGYNVANSLRFNSGDNASLNKTFSGAGNQQIMTFSVWIKRSQLANTNEVFSQGSGSGCHLNFQSSGTLELNLRNSVDGGSNRFVITNRLFRDPTAWYHVVLATDTTQSTASNRIKLYINGVQETSFSTADYPSQNGNLLFNEASNMRIGRSVSDNFEYGGYMAEFVFIDGQQLDPTSFGEFDEDSPTIWKPKSLSGLTFGSNGFHLDFENSSDLGNDVSGNNNDFTATSLASTDQTIDSCTNNFCTLNPLHKSTTNVELSEGNLRAYLNQSTGWQHAAGTMAVNSGKWYWEAKATTVSAVDKTSIGVLQFNTSDVDFILNTNTDRSSKGLSGHGAGTGGYSYSQGDIIMCAMDIDNNKIYWGKNGTFFGTLDPANGTGSTTQAVDNDNFCVPVVGGYGGSVWELNFGVPQFSISSGNSDAEGFGNFEYAPPSGFFSLCSKNIAEYG